MACTPTDWLRHINLDTASPEAIADLWSRLPNNAPEPIERRPYCVWKVSDDITTAWWRWILFQFQLGFSLPLTGALGKSCESRSKELYYVPFREQIDKYAGSAYGHVALRAMLRYDSLDGTLPAEEECPDNIVELVAFIRHLTMELPINWGKWPAILRGHYLQGATASKEVYKGWETAPPLPPARAIVRRKKLPAEVIASEDSFDVLYTIDLEGRSVKDLIKLYRTRVNPCYTGSDIGYVWAQLMRAKSGLFSVRASQLRAAGLIPHYKEWLATNCTPESLAQQLEYKVAGLSAGHWAEVGKKIYDGLTKGSFPDYGVGPWMRHTDWLSMAVNAEESPLIKVSESRNIVDESELDLSLVPPLSVPTPVASPVEVSTTSSDFEDLVLQPLFGKTIAVRLSPDQHCGWHPDYSASSPRSFAQWRPVSVWHAWRVAHLTFRDAIDTSREAYALLKKCTTDGPWNGRPRTSHTWYFASLDKAVRLAIRVEGKEVSMRFALEDSDRPGVYLDHALEICS